MDASEAIHPVPSPKEQLREALNPDSKQYEHFFLELDEVKRVRSSHHVASEAEVLQVQAWMNFCFHNHTDCADRELQRRFPTSQKILLIDTLRLCLVNGRTSYRYFALSYVL